MDKEADKILEAIENLNEKVKDIKIILAGHDEYKTEGLIKAIGKNTEFRENMTKRFWIVTGFLAALSLITGFKENIAALFTK